jgi:diguanylate cyclase (GGDEF)-like protein/PAS domain S-box-containing protein
MLLAAVPAAAAPPDLPWATFHFAVAALYLMLATVLFRARDISDARLMGFAMVGAAITQIGQVVIRLVPTLDGVLVGGWLVYLGTSLVPPLLLAFVLASTGLVRLGGMTVGLLLVIPALSTVLVVTNPLHQLVWAHPPLGANGQPDIRSPEWGPWFLFVHAPYFYLVTLIALVAAARQLFSPIRIYRAQALLLSVAIAIPVIANLLQVTGHAPGRVSLASLGYAAGGLLMAWGVLRLQLFRLKPVAHQVVMESIGDGVLVIDAFERIADVNGAALRLVARSSDQVVGRPPSEALGPDHPLVGIATGSDRTEAEFEADGRQVEVRISAIADPSGRTRARAIYLRDVTERRAAEAALKARETLLENLIEHSPNGILTLRPGGGPDGWPRDFTCLVANSAAARFMGTTREALIGSTIKTLDLAHKALITQALKTAAHRRETTLLEIDDPVGSETRWYQLIINPVGDDLLATIVDVTNRRQREVEIEAIAKLDPLTGLFNRRGFEGDARPLLERLALQRQAGVLVYFDLDRFKEVNDRFGHAAGDSLLIELAARLKRNFRDTVLLARLGGDEFAALVPNVTLEQAAGLVGRLGAALALPYSIGPHAVTCPASIGVASFSGTGNDLDRLLAAADEAMFQEKGARRAAARPSVPNLPHLSTAPAAEAPTVP